jgi:hypothetical protein
MKRAINVEPLQAFDIYDIIYNTFNVTSQHVMIHSN